MFFKPLPQTDFHIHKDQIVTGHINRHGKLVDIRKAELKATLENVLIVPTGRVNMSPITLPIKVIGIKYLESNEYSVLAPLLTTYELNFRGHMLTLTAQIKAYYGALVNSKWLTLFEPSVELMARINAFVSVQHKVSLTDYELIEWVKKLDKLQFGMLRRWCLNRRAHAYVETSLKAYFPKMSDQEVCLTMERLADICVIKSKD